MGHARGFQVLTMVPVASGFGLLAIEDRIQWMDAGNSFRAQPEA